MPRRLTAPLLIALVALAIKLDSPGPVFYRQERVGRGGEPFERGAQLRVVARQGVGAHEQPVRLHLLGVAREDFVEQLGEL